MDGPGRGGAGPRRVGLAGAPGPARGADPGRRGRADRVGGAGLLAPAPVGPASWRAEPFPYVLAILAGAALALLTGA